MNKQKPKTEGFSVVRSQVALAFSAFILIGATDGALGVLLPGIRDYYRVDKATVALLFLAGTAGYFIAGLTSGLLVEKLGQRLFLMLGPTAIILGSASLIFTPPFPILLVNFLMVGFGIAIIDAGLNSYIAGLPRSTSLLNYLHAFYGIGALLGPIIASFILALSWGWNTIYCNRSRGINFLWFYLRYTTTY